MFEFIRNLLRLFFGGSSKPGGRESDRYPRILSRFNSTRKRDVAACRGEFGEY